MKSVAIQTSDKRDALGQEGWECPPKDARIPSSQPPLTVKETKALERAKICSELSEFGEEYSLESRYLAKSL